MSNQKFKDEYLFNYYLSENRLEEAEQLIERSGIIDDKMRQIALTYSDLEDVENSIRTFKRAYEMGDIKSLPWLIELLENFQPIDPDLPSLIKTRHELLASEHFDLIFSIGNMHLLKRDFPAVFQTWKKFLGTDNWLIDRNLLSEATQNPENYEVLRALGYQEDESLDSVILFLKMRYLHYVERTSESIFDFLAFCERYANHIEVEQIQPQSLIEIIYKFAKDGIVDLIFMGYSIAIAGDLDAAPFSDLIKNYQLTELAEQTGFSLERDSHKVNTQNLLKPASGNYISNRQNPDDVFARAEQAIKDNDFEAELAAWIEGAKSGVAGCINNIGVAMGNKLGITSNLFLGSTGGEDSAWSPLIKGIQMNEMKPAEFELVSLERPLGSNLINSNSKEKLPPSSLEAIEKFIHLIKYLGFNYKKLSENIFCLPYASEGKFIPIFAELVNDEGKDSLLIYAPTLTSSIEERRAVNANLPLSAFERDLFKILIRDVHLVLPNSGIFLGDSFSSIPKDKVPTHFLSSCEAQELWLYTGPFNEDLLLEPIPTYEKFQLFQFGLAIDNSLQSDHYETAVREAFKQVIGVIQHLSKMYLESAEYWNQFFDHVPISDAHYDLFAVNDEEAIKAGVLGPRIGNIFRKYIDTQRVENLIDLQSIGIPLAKRLMAAVEINKNNVDVVSKNLLELVAEREEDVDLREGLNNVAWFYLQNNYDFDEFVLPILEKAASLGSGNAMSTLSWQLMLFGRHKEAVDYFDKYYYRIMTTRFSDLDFYQGANLRSNHALNLWALGEPHDRLKEIWQDNLFQANHGESQFYPLLVDFMDGKESAARTGLSQLSQSTKEEMISIFQETSEEENWFGEVSRKALELLEVSAKKKRGLFSRR